MPPTLIFERLQSGLVPLNGHLVWSKALYPSGHGVIRIKVDGKWVNRGTHRLWWMMHNGPIPDGQDVLHNNECDVPNCALLEHLHLGTQDQNNQERWANRVHPILRSGRHLPIAGKERKARADTRVSRTCERCGLEFKIMASRAAKGYGRFHNKGCRDASELKPAVDRFWGGVKEKPQAATACWPRNAASNAKGYTVFGIGGQRKNGGRMVLAHVFAWNLRAPGSIPKGWIIGHTVITRPASGTTGTRVRTYCQMVDQPGDLGICARHSG
jgi:hypothetical protein